MLSALWGVAFLPGLLCFGGMGLCMWMMIRGSRSSKDEVGRGTEHDASLVHVSQDQSSRIAALEAEVASLRAERRDEALRRP